MIVECVKETCASNKVSGVVIDEVDENQPIIHFVCEQCGTEWVE